ncbi:MAG: flagellar export protein FliJ [Candidatus Nitrohelix vancouverensis]|uniref:Flagellar FliJ protein n=1 Tax=Candidatus Nitrohelix vancouverensis TaxID=2705534 RepID=A0A7T0G3C1_9BACT|nr:MAG: flagellar export protein FliJ [Candidatus Nitrohelix vancouverensis]
MKFKLEALLKLNKNKEDLVLREMGKINHHLQNQKQRQNFMTTVAKERGESRNQKISGTVTANTLAIYDNFFQGVKIQNARQTQIISEVSERMEKTRERLVEAMRKRKTLEILKSAQLKKFRAKQQKREIKEMDEMATNLWRRHDEF